MNTMDNSDIKLTEEVKQQVREGMANDQSPASLTTIRAALADVLDTGDEDGQPWDHFYEIQRTNPALSWTQDNANGERVRFMDAVVRRIAQLQHAPHHYDAALLAKLRDVRAEYQRGYRDGRSDATGETEEER